MDQPATNEPCPECGEPKKLDAVLHPGTSYVECQVCKHRGPELVPKADPDGQHRPAAVWAAWNAHAQAKRQHAALTSQPANF